MTIQRFRLRYGIFRWLLSAVGTGPGLSRIEVNERDVRVRMGWAFAAVIPLPSVVSAERDRDMRWGIGVHGARGRWLVNGSVTGIVTITVDPPTRARVMGVPVRLRLLHLSLEDPDGFVAALSAGARA